MINLKENLIDINTSTPLDRSTLDNKRVKTQKNKPIKVLRNTIKPPPPFEVVIKELLEQKIMYLASSLQGNLKELNFWIESHWQKALSAENADEQITLMRFLHVATRYQLDPMLGEIMAWDENGTRHFTISIDGWIKLINSHSAFKAMTISESHELEEGIPAWMECAIYRTDRELPIRIREYYVEVKGESAVWKKMPRRMLRHRVIQQCARLSFSISQGDLDGGPNRDVLNTKIIDPLTTQKKLGGESAMPSQLYKREQLAINQTQRLKSRLSQQSNKQT